MTIKISKELIDETLRSKKKKGKRMLEPLQSFVIKNRVPLGLLEDTDVSGDAEVHKKAGDLWQCVEGEVAFVCGGELVDPKNRKGADGLDDPNELYAKEIKGGSKFLLKAGEWLWIPPGEPHMHSAFGTARLFIVKIPVV